MLHPLAVNPGLDKPNPAGDTYSMTSRSRQRKPTLPTIYRALYLGSNGDMSQIVLPKYGPESLAAHLRRIIGGPPALLHVADDSGDWIIVNRQAEKMCLPQNPAASIMAGQCVQGNCLVCPASIRMGG